MKSKYLENCKYFWEIDRCVRNVQSLITKICHFSHFCLILHVIRKSLVCLGAVFDSLFLEYWVIISSIISGKYLAGKLKSKIRNCMFVHDCDNNFWWMIQAMKRPNNNPKTTPTSLFPFKLQDACLFVLSNSLKNR